MVKCVPCVLLYFTKLIGKGRYRISLLVHATQERNCSIKYDRSYFRNLIYVIYIILLQGHKLTQKNKKRKMPTSHILYHP